MNEQISFSLSDEVAPYFKDQYVKQLCSLIDEKANTGLKYNDLKFQLLTRLKVLIDLDNQEPEFDHYRRAYEFAKYF